MTYTRRDEAQVTIPVVTVYRRGDSAIDQYRVYLDLAPVYADAGQALEPVDPTR